MLEDINEIQKYKGGLLTDEEKKAFEDKMKNNQVLKKMVEEYDEYSIIADAIIENDLIYKIKKERRHLNQKKNIIIGSIILIMVAIFFSYKFLLPSKNPVVYADLYEQYYSPPMGNITRNENGNTAVIKSCDLAHQLLDEKKYDEALSQFKLALKDTETRCREKSEFYIALLHLRNNNFLQATKQLKVISEQPNHSFNKKAIQILDQL